MLKIEVETPLNAIFGVLSCYVPFCISRSLSPLHMPSTVSTVLTGMVCASHHYTCGRLLCVPSSGTQAGYTNHKYAGQPSQDWIMWTRRTGKSLSDRAGQRAFLGEGGAGTRSQKQGQVAGTEQGARPRESPGARREAPPGDTAHRKAGSAESHTHPPLGCGSSAVAGGLLRGTCSLDVGGGGER